MLNYYSLYLFLDMKQKSFVPIANKSDKNRFYWMYFERHETHHWTYPATHEYIYACFLITACLYELSLFLIISISFPYVYQNIC